MNISDLIGPGQVILNLRVKDKTRLLEELSRIAASFVGLEAKAIYRPLQSREQLGSTGVGRGIALPHARINGIRSLFGLFVRLSRPIEFQAIDEKPVDVAFLLLIPANSNDQYIAALAAISRRLRDADLVQRLRTEDSEAAVYRMLVEE